MNKYIFIIGFSINIICGQNPLKNTSQYSTDSRGQNSTIDKGQLENAVSEIKKFGIPFKYPQGGCESRAFAMGLVLDSLKVENFRIWVFARSKIENGNYELLKIKDINDKDNIITWGYHTAPAVRYKIDSKIDTLIIDPSLKSKPVKYADWLALMDGYKNSYYTFTDNDYFMFYTSPIDSTTNKVDFFKYEGDIRGYNYGDLKLEKNLAIDYTGRFIYNKYLKNNNDPSVALLRPIVESINNFENFLLRDQLPSDNQVSMRQIYEKYPDFVEDTKTRFNRHVRKWYNTIKIYHRPQ